MGKPAASGGSTLSRNRELARLAARPSFLKNYLNPAPDAGIIERTIPDKPRSSKQRYRKPRH